MASKTLIITGFGSCSPPTDNARTEADQPMLNSEDPVCEMRNRLLRGSEALGTELRFPLFVSTITTDAVEALKKTRAQVPRGTLDWIQDFEAGLEAGLTADQRFDFRIYLIPHTEPKSTADAALTFVRADQFTPEQNAIMQQVQTIIREKKVPVGT